LAATVVRLAGYIIFGICTALGAVMVGQWCYERITAYRSGRGRRW
jgi:hypothetical protein